MKESLRKRLQNLLKEYKTKKQHYQELTHSYSLSCEWRMAADSDIKMRMYDNVIKDLESTLAE